MLILKVIVFPLQKRGQQIASGTQGVGIYEWADAPGTLLALRKPWSKT